MRTRETSTNWFIWNVLLVVIESIISLVIQVRKAMPSSKLVRRAKPRLLVTGMFCLVAYLMLSTLTATFFHWNFVKEEYAAQSKIHEETIHIAMIFDKQVLEQARQLIRSIIHYSGGVVYFHLVTNVPSALFEQEFSGSLLHFYDYSRCFVLAGSLSGLSSMHIAAICKMFLADIIPVDKVLFSDVDVTCTSDIQKCWIPLVTELGMAVEMGDTCQTFPHKCWPLGYVAAVQRNLTCGGDPQRTEHNNRIVELGYCPKTGDLEPFQVNSGVILMDLERMRKNGFVEKLIATIVDTYRTIDLESRWGDQEFLNNYLRFFPQELTLLPCQCNFQWTAIRRKVRCPRASVVLAHGFHRGVGVRTPDPFNKHFYHFVDDIKSMPPQVPATGMLPGGPYDEEKEFFPRFDCPLQPHYCGKPLDKTNVFNETLFVLTRTSGRPSFLHENVLSVQMQTFAKIVHLVLTDSNETFSTHKHLHILRHENLKWLYNKSEVDNCPGIVEGNPPHAPLIGDTRRQPFFECFCNTSFPFNHYLEHLIDKVVEMGGGVILFLDDDNILPDPSIASKIMASFESKRGFLIFKSKLGRITPASDSFVKNRIERGDIDLSNIVFHSDQARHLNIDMRRCIDYHIAYSLDQHLKPRFVDKIIAQSHPLQGSFLGRGSRNDILKLTAVITGYQTAGYRPAWLRRHIQFLASEDLSSIIDKVILVWNNPDTPSPTFQGSNVVVVDGGSNSLSNRWILTLPHISTEAVLNFDDDIMVNKAAILCMYSYYLKHRNSMVAPFARQVQENMYVLSELTHYEPFSLLLPRVLLLPKYVMEEYSKTNATILDYIDGQEGHCDDVLLNAVARFHLNVSLVRVILPPESIFDPYSTCWKLDRQLTGGLATKGNRSALRTECTSWINRHFHAVLNNHVKNIIGCDQWSSWSLLKSTDNDDAYLHMFQDVESCE